MNKLIFGLNQTDGHNECYYDHEDLITGGMSAEVKATLTENSKFLYSKVSKVLNQFKPTIIIGGVSFVGIYAVKLFRDFIIESDSINNMLGILNYILITIVVICVLLVIYCMFKLRFILKSDEIKSRQNSTQDMLQSAANMIEFPDDLYEIDIFLTSYEVKNNKRKVLNKKNEKCVIYKQDDNISIYGTTDLITFPISSIKSIHEEKDKIDLYTWNKQQSFKGDIYKKYKIKQKKGTILTIKLSYKITLDVQDNTYELHIPNYEIDNFKEVIK